MDAQTMVNVKLENHENRITYAERAIEELKQTTKTVQDLALSMNKMSMNMESMLAEMKDQGQRLQTLEQAPGKMWSSAKKTAFTSIVSAISTALAVGVIYMIAQYIH